MCGQSSIPDSFLSEGRGMAEAFAADLVAAGFTVERMIDESICPQHPPPAHGLTYHRIRASEEEKPLFEKLADAADYTVVIAPETKGSLAERVQWAVKSKGKLLGPCQNLIELTADKHRLALHLSARGIPVPPGVAVPAGNSLPVDFEYPAVLKERDGAGSQQMQYLRHADPNNFTSFEARLETHVDGQAISVGVLGGPGGITALPACRQDISQDGKFTYRGGSIPLSDQLSSRGESLAKRAVSACGEFRGYLGVDLILGTEADKDYVIEINPRLTTSYLILRQAAKENLAEAIIQWSLKQCPAPEFSPQSVSIFLDNSHGEKV